jgi:hypothetical protein
MRVADIEICTCLNIVTDLCGNVKVDCLTRLGLRNFLKECIFVGICLYTVKTL